MGQQHTIGKHATSVYKDNGVDVVKYHATEIVRLDGQTVTLNTGGWNTNTTKTRMNQAANAWGLAFRVFAKDFAWYVETPYGVLDFFEKSLTFSLKA